MAPPDEDPPVQPAARPRPDAAAETLILRPDGEDTASTPAPTDGLEGFDELAKLGEGGMGEVFRVRDADLERPVAIKVIRASLLANPDRVSRFLAEARTTARLQHPGVVAVHRLGRLPDGRHFFTMQEVLGRTFDAVIREVHRASSPAAWGEARGGWSFRRLLAVFVQVCDTVGFAHTQGVVHRDLKPANVMLGEHGEVFVLDWGIAKVRGQVDHAIRGGDGLEAISGRTRSGEIAGTPAWMSPEQARAEHHVVGPWSDVWALGGILHMILYGVRPYHHRKGMSVIAAVTEGPPDPVEGPGPPVPPELEAIRALAMRMEPQARFSDADALAAEVRRWLDGAARREQALDLVQRARALAPTCEHLRQQAQELRVEMRARLSLIPRWAPESEKIAAWSLGAEADRAEGEADLVDVEVEQLLQGAVAHDADLAEAHVALAERWRARHAAAESAHDAREASRTEAMLRAVVERLPAGSAARRSHESWLRGSGRLRLATPGRRVHATLHRFVPRFGRLVPELVEELGPTPIERVLPMGSYRVDLRLEDGHVVHYPVLVERGVAVEDRSVTLPRAGELGPDDCFVPAGWVWRGGDPSATGGRPRTRAWVDAFVIRRFPVTNHEFIEFLHDLVDRGRADDALRHAPRERAGTVGQLGALIYGRDADGRFVLRPDADGDPWLPDWPVMMVDWIGSAAYAQAYSARTGLGWRLPTDAEWGKAARGVDGRFFVWGDGFDPSWCNMADSRPDRPFPQPVDSFPVDESPYGVRGLAGNVRDWCWDRDASTGRRYNRGGFWIGSAREARAADRHLHEETHRGAEIGFRLARPWPG